MSDTPELIQDACAAIGEGPVWDDRAGRLYWIDILSRCVHVYDPATGAARQIDVGQQIGCLVLCETGNAVVALQDGVYRLELDSGKMQMFCDVESDLPGNRLNDGKCDPAGRLWVGSMSLTQNDGSSTSPPAGSLYCIDPNGEAKKKLDGITISNGLAWSADHKTMYYIDSPTRNVVAFEYDIDTGDIRNGRTVVSVPEDEGIPDGMTIDAEGMLWIGHWCGWKVGRHDPRTGRCVQSLSLPVEKVTCCTFAGSDLRDLYITTAAIGTDESSRPQPHAGGLFRHKSEIPGLPTCRFGI